MLTTLASIKEQLQSQSGAYRFLYTPESSITNKYWFVGLNPGGSSFDESSLSVEEKNAFISEKWGKYNHKTNTISFNQLQQQVHHFFQSMSTNLNIQDWEKEMSQNWMISNYVFYKSKNWAQMASKKEHIETSRKIWKELISTNQPKIIVANGFDTYEKMSNLMLEDNWTKESEKVSFNPWEGPHILVLKKESKKCLIIGFAHLSTFKIMKREKNKLAMKNVYELIKRYS
jgi:hypothetical protein